MTGKTTLLLVDAQEDFLARPGLTPDRATLIATLAGLLGHARQHGWRVIHVHSRVDRDLANAMPHRRNPETSEVVAGTDGILAPAELAPREGEGLLFKRFFSAFDAVGLEELLKAEPGGPLVVGGVHSHACIRDTVSDAYRLGFEVVIPEGATASYDPAHAALALDWMNGRSASIVPVADFGGAAAVTWPHRDPCDQRRILQDVRLTPATELREAAARLVAHQPALAELGIEGRRSLLAAWRQQLEQSRDLFRDAMVRDVAKPLRDAEGEITYGLALLDDVIGRLADEDAEGGPVVRYRPRGLVGLITPWNNPFAIAVGKIAPALGYGNDVLWKPALAATGIAKLLAESLKQSGLDEWIAMVPGDSGTGEAIVGDDLVAAISFTGSVAVGRRLIARAGVRPTPIPVQAELGASNAAIVDSSADIAAAATDLAGAMFSFSGQRCTAIRRVILLDDIADQFIDRLVAAATTLKVGLPGDPDCDVGPVIAQQSRDRLLAGIELAVRDGGRLLCGGRAPAHLSRHGCWIEPTLVDGLDPGHPLNQQEWFGPLASLIRAKDFEQALSLHNGTGFGLLGALYATDESRVAAFERGAEAGMLSINKARPGFAASGPFTGWKASGHGIAEHGRWNRDFYAQPQALYAARR